MSIKADRWIEAMARTHGMIDPFSANYLRGTVIDFSDNLTGGGFKISNPNARHPRCEI